MKKFFIIFCFYNIVLIFPLHPSSMVVAVDEILRKTSSPDNFTQVIDQTLNNYVSLDKTQVLNLLEKEIKERIFFNQKHSTRYFNYEALGYGSGFFAAVLLTGYFLVNSIITRHNTYDKKFEEAALPLREKGIFFTQEFSGKTLLITTHRPFFVSNEVEDLINTTVSQLKSIRNEQFNGMPPITIRTFFELAGYLAIFSFLKISWDYFKNGLFPNYKDQAVYYEELLKELKDYYFKESC